MLSHYSKICVVHIPLLLSKIVWCHWCHSIGSVCVMRPITTSPLDDKAIRSVANKTVTTHVCEQYAACIEHIGISIVISSISNLSHFFPQNVFLHQSKVDAIGFVSRLKSETTPAPATAVTVATDLSPTSATFPSISFAFSISSGEYCLCGDPAEDESRSALLTRS